MDKSEDAFRTISEAAEDLDLPQHVLRFWETRFPQIRPMKRGGGRRYYRPDDVELLRAIRHLLYNDGYTIKGVQRILKERGVRAVLSLHGDNAGSRPVAAKNAPQVPAMAPRAPAAIEPWSGPTMEALDEAAVPGSVNPQLMLRPAPYSDAPSAQPGVLTASSAQAQTSQPALRRFAPEWTADQHRKLTAIVAELAECRRILSAANI